MPRGIMEILWTGSVVSRNSAIRACPVSWNATISFSFLFITRVFFSSPAITLSMASSNSSIPTDVLPFLAARRADSFTRFARSAPTNPGVRAATTLRSTSSASFTPLMCTFRISSLPFMSGRSTRICLSNLPARKRAGSRISGLFVAAIIITPAFVSNPSISESS